MCAGQWYAINKLHCTSYQITGCAMVKKPNENLVSVLRMLVFSLLMKQSCQNVAFRVEVYFAIVVQIYQ